MKNYMKAVIYARYSSDSQREESIEGQLRECKVFAEKNGFTVFSTYIDRALSAKSDNRPEFQRMIKDSEKSLFDVIIVWKLDRFARNRYDSAHYKAVLRKHGVQVMSATEVIASDSTGILLESMLEGMAEYYSAELAEKVNRGMTENAIKGKYNGGNLTPGYLIDKEQHFQIDPMTAPLILEAFNLYASGKTMKQLVDILNDKGVRTSRGSKVTLNFVNNLLKNRRYIGEYKYREIVNTEMIPPIVPNELFDRVQERIAKNKKAPARHKAKEEYYLLSTKLFCGSCGALMVGESGTSRTMKIHRYYKCASVKQKKGCTHKPIKKDFIETLVVDNIKRIVFDDSLIERIADMLLNVEREESAALPLLEKQMKETERAISNMLNAIQQGIFNESTKQRLDELEAQKHEIEIKILQEQIQHNRLSRKQIIHWLHHFRKLDTDIYEHRERLVNTFLNAVYVYDDRILLMLNYKDGAKTVSLGDIEQSGFGSGAVSPNDAACSRVGSDLEWFGAPKRSYLNSHQKIYPMGVFHSIIAHKLLHQAQQLPHPLLCMLLNGLQPFL
ncbi:MAG: recombinase family protein [Clostridiales Family XIII bacterium]|jgi:DNA invertase Pin-like site-specific DNA recombinase|nr:recombinase family protein [Clostridiales Family XIII bacterium]